MSEFEHMKAYLEFVQREPLPTTDAAARHRLDEAAVNWPAAAALFAPHIEALTGALFNALLQSVRDDHLRERMRPWLKIEPSTVDQPAPVDHVIRKRCT